jgi:myosin heavy subunit
VAVNPYKELPLYTDERLRSYVSHEHGAQPPHIFAIAEMAYRSVTEEKCNQSVVVSGESGAGKTVSCKWLIHYLVNITNNQTRVEQQLVYANHVLESFGNACTLRNDNSSRFGKFTKIKFDEKGKIAGARITDYLLEKSRIVHQEEGERNFHIFYELLCGAPAELCKKVGSLCY